MTSKIKNTSYSVLVVGVNSSDILCGIYLIIVFAADTTLTGTFAAREHLWRSGIVCMTAFTMVLWFTLLTESVLFLLSFSRVMLVVNPFDTKFKHVRFITTVLCFLILFSLFIAIVIVSFYVSKEIYIPTSLCLPFIDPTGKVLMIKIITWFTVITQLFTSLSILAMNILFLLKVQKSRQLLSKNQTHNADTSLIVQLIIIITSNILCWFSTNTVYIVAMFVPTYPVNLIIWMTVLGLPINSIINPLIFSIVHCRKRLQLDPNK